MEAYVLDVFVKFLDFLDILPCLLGNVNVHILELSSKRQS